MSLYHGYEPASGHCSGGSTPGARALMSWSLARYGPLGLRNGGIYNCRHIANTTTWSLHSEGRACDLMIPVDARLNWGMRLFLFLVDNSADLGLQLAMFRGRVWSGSRPTRPDGSTNLRSISSTTNQHLDHIHVELSRLSAGLVGVDTGHHLTVQDIETARLHATPVYVVRHGDTLWSIRRRFCPQYTVFQLYRRNQRAIEDAAIQHGRPNSNNG